MGGANGSHECAPDDKLRDVNQLHLVEMMGFAGSTHLRTTPKHAGTHEVFDEAVGSVALQIDDLQKFRAQAAAVARQLGSSAVPALSSRLHSPPRPEPPGFDGGQRGLGGWLSAWQFAIFELFFEFGTAALPVLRQVAFGEYDWIQGNAVEVLVRLAAKGIEREQIIGELRREFPRFREEAQLYAVGPLLHHAARDPAVAAVVRQLEDMPAWRAAAEELREADDA
jgi:hypothetical protein